MDVVLEVVVALARDLQKEFYPHFPDIFDRCVDLLQNNQDTQLLEQVFMCLAYLFKFLWRYTAKDFRWIFWLFSIRGEARTYSCIRR